MMMASRRMADTTERFLKPLLRTSNLSFTKVQVLGLSDKASKKTEKDEFDDGPTQFSTSQAASYNSIDELRRGYRKNSPDFEPTVVRFSLAVFLLYFLVLREESDWDFDIGDNIFNKVPDLEIVVLRQKKEGNSGMGLFTAEDEKRLQELEMALANRKN